MSQMVLWYGNKMVHYDMVIKVFGMSQMVLWYVIKAFGMSQMVLWYGNKSFWHVTNGSMIW